MSSSSQSFASTPTFEVFRRGLNTQAIQKFRGINSYSTFPQLGPEWAQDLLNVVVSGSGGLSKLRLPIPLSPIFNSLSGFALNSFWDFQQANGTRQVLINIDQNIFVLINDLVNVIFNDINPLNRGSWSFAEANNILFGANGSRMMKWIALGAFPWLQWGIEQPSLAPVAPGVVAGTLSPTTGYTYSYAYKYSVTGHVGNVSLVSPSTGPQVNKGFRATANFPLSEVPPDTTSDTIVWFRNLDGGGDQFRLAEVNLLTGAVITFASGALVTVVPATGNLTIEDNTPDGSLDQTTQGPLINNLPLQGRYVAVGQNRVFVANLIGSPQDIIYSGYEQILLGRPEESFPPNNRLRLSIGAEVVAGIGILQAGVVAFSQTGRMFMLRGLVEDIVLNAPVNFSAYLEELPWNLGCVSHFTIQNTAYGLIWLAGDKTVQLFDGQSEPIDISPGVYPYLRRITPGTEAQCVGAYFNWLERDWYTLTACVDGSLTINRIFFFAFNKTPGSNQLQSVEVFVSDIPATLVGTVPWMGVITNSKLQRMLCISAGGRIQQLPVSSDTVNGITVDYTINPATTGLLNAFWRGGYFGSENPGRMKTFRWLRLVADQDTRAFKALLRFVDDEQRTFQNPELRGPYVIPNRRLGIGWRAKRMSVEIDFPAIDAPCNVLELQAPFIGTSDR